MSVIQALHLKTIEYFGHMILYISSISVASSVSNLCSLLDLFSLPSKDYLVRILFFKKWHKNICY